MMQFPKPLNPGDTIGLVSPASPITQEERDRCIQVLEEMGYRVTLGSCLRKLLNYHNYLSGEARLRADEINRMFADPAVKAIFCTRGGYGSSHIMPYLDYGLVRQNPKIFVGFSDITNIHTAFQMFGQIVTFHGPMVKSNMLKGFDDYTRESLFAALNMKDSLEFLNPPQEDTFHVINDGMAKGMLTGGNLSLIARSIGTFFQPDTTGKLLFLEDIGESIARIDMYITQMEYAGIFDYVKGILFGDFTDCTHDDYDAAYKIDDFLKDRFSGYPVPVMSNIRSGHNMPMGTIPLGTECTLDAYHKTITFSKSQKPVFTSGNFR